MSNSASTLTGTGTLVRLILRRDRVRIPMWIIGIVGFAVSFLPALPDLYPDQRSLDARAALLRNPATIAMSGPGYGTDHYTFGAMVANEFLMYVILLVSLMSLFLVVRHTRLEEETGRAELVGAGTVGRYAQLTAAVSVGVVVNLVIAALLVALMPSALDALDMPGTILFAVSVAACGIAFTGVAAVVSQLTFSARGATGIGFAVFGLSFLLRAAGDAGGLSALSWASPIGWSQRTAPYVHDRWWPLVFSLVATVALFVLAVVLNRRRDVGLGIFASRRGPANASASLSGPIGLAWRLQRGTVLAWFVGLLVFGLVYGTIAPEIETFANDNPVVAEAIGRHGGSLVEGFFGVVTMLFAMLASGFGVSSTLRLHGEETAGRVEPLLARPISRMNVLSGHVLIAMSMVPVLIHAAALTVGVSASIALHDWSLLGHITVTAAVHIPAVWVFVGITVALIGWLPKLSALAWLPVAYAVLVGLLGVFLQLPDWAIDLSPFSHVPQTATEDVTAGPLVALGALTAALIAAGYIGLRRRDMR